MKIIIGGDLVINKNYSTSLIDPDIVELFQNSDLNILNLEAPVTDSTVENLKTGPHIKSNRGATLEVLKELKINLVTLANNHLKDYGDKGISDTIKFLENNQIEYIGAGKDLEEASKIKYIQRDGMTLGIINVAENEWSNASENESGANPLDVINNYYQIQQAKQKSDFLIVIIHGGNEYYNLPSPRLQKLFRFFADADVDLIVGHHTHCISGFEEYNNTPIYYSLGNFLFTKPSNYDDWYIGSLLEVSLLNDKMTTNVKFVKQNKENYQLTLLKDIELKKVEERFKEYTEVISDEKLLNERWDLFVDSKYKLYLNYWSAKSYLNNRIIKRLLALLKIDLLNKKGVSLYLNLMRCEAHFDISRNVLKRYLNK